MRPPLRVCRACSNAPGACLTDIVLDSTKPQLRLWLRIAATEADGRGLISMGEMRMKRTSEAVLDTDHVGRATNRFQPFGLSIIFCACQGRGFCCNHHVSINLPEQASIVPRRDPSINNAL